MSYESNYFVGDMLIAVCVFQGDLPEALDLEVKPSKFENIWFFPNPTGGFPILAKEDSVMIIKNLAHQ